MGHGIIYSGIIFVVGIFLFISGCASINGSEKINQSRDNFNKTNDETVIGAPLSVFIKAGSEKQMLYKNHKININYVMAIPQHTVEISRDSMRQNITISHDLTCIGQHCQYNGVIGGQEYLVEPVTRKGDVWSAGTWDTEELYIEISANSGPK